MKRKIASFILAVIMCFNVIAVGVSAAADPSIFTGNEWYDETSTVGVNRLYPRSTFVPFGSVELAKENPTDILKVNSDRVVDLNGTWKFNLVQKPADRPDISDMTVADAESTEGWTEISVPSSWQVAGQYAGVYGDYPIYNNQDYPWQGKQYEGTRLNGVAPTKVNPVGSYIRTFEIPEDWDGSQIFISFQGVESAMYVWVNGVEIGYGEDSFTTDEFDITDAVHTGTNTISVQVFRWSTGSYLENQDGINFGGICRDVFIFATPKVHIRDFKVETDFDENYVNADLDLRLNVQNHTSETAEGYSARVSMYKADGSLLFSDMTTEIGSVEGESETVVNLSRLVESPEQWSAETPYLYTMIIELIDAEGNTVEVIPKRVGFKEIILDRETNPDEWLMRVNGKAVIFYGVNRGEVSPTTGRYLDYETLVKDVQNAKLLNINSFRTSHYPATPALYDLCDEYGIYVMDENNNESHNGRSYSPAVPNSSAWTESCRARITHLVERDKNNTCVVMWSIGNEAGSGENTTMMINLARELDDTKLIHYQGDNPGKNDEWKSSKPDMYALMYPSASSMQSYTGKYPHVAMEYAHGMGNAMGGLYAYTTAFETNDRVQGGWIWDYIDQAVDTLVPGTETGETYWGVGGSWLDVADQGGIGDGNFCANGFINPDRTLKPAAYEVKKQYQAIKMEAEDLMTGKIKFNNYNLYLNANYYNVKWELVENDTVIQHGVLEDIDVPASTSAVVEIPYTVPAEPKAGADYFLNISLELKNDTVYADAGYVQCSEQFEMPFSTGSTSVEISDIEDKFSSTSNDDNEVKASGYTEEGKSFSVTIDKKTGLMTSLAADDKELLAESPVPNMFRAELDNDTSGTAYNGSAAPFQAWANIADEMTVENVDVSIANDNIVRVIVSAKLGNSTPSSYSIIYNIYANGDVTVTATLTPNSSMPNLGEYGMIAQFDPSLENFTYFGRGPEENYDDRAAGYDVGVYETTATDNFYSYIRPQENGNRTGVRWAAITDDDGNGLMIIPEEGETLSVNASHYTPLSLSSYNNKTPSDPNYPIQRYQFQPKATDNVVLRIAERQQGVGGETWATGPYSEYLLRSNQTYSYTYTIRPVFSGQNMMDNSEGLVSGIKMIDSITIDGEPIDSFDPYMFSYSYIVDKGASAPVVAASGDESIDIVVEQAAGVPGEAKIYATSNGITSVYTVSFTEATAMSIAELPFMFEQNGWQNIVRNGTVNAGAGAAMQIYKDADRKIKETFSTGLGVHASAYIVLDISSYGANWFEFTFGADANYTKSNNDGPSANMKVYTSETLPESVSSVEDVNNLINSGEFKQVYESGTRTRTSGSAEGKVSIKSAKCMIIVVDQINTNGHDHFIIADPMLSYEADTTALNEKIDLAKELLASTEEGGLVGQYPSDARAALESAISAAEGTASSAQNQSEIDAAVKSLEEKILEYKAAEILEMSLVTQSLSVTGESVTAVFAVKNNVGGTREYNTILTIFDEEFNVLASDSKNVVSSSDNDDSSMTLEYAGLTEGVYYVRLALTGTEGELLAPYIIYRVENGEATALPKIPAENVADSVAVEFPAEVTANEKFTVEVNAVKPFDTVEFYNENGTMIKAKLISREDDGLNTSLQYEMSIGTPGQGRVLSVKAVSEGIYADAGAVEFDVVRAYETEIKSVEVPELAEQNTEFELKAITSGDVEKLTVLNEEGNKIASRIKSSVMADGDIQWVLSLSVGTKGARSLKLVANSKYGEAEYPVNIQIGTDPEVFSAEIIGAGESVAPHEQFEIAVKTSVTVEKLVLTADNGKNIGYTVKSMNDEDGVRNWNIVVSLGTEGERVLKIGAYKVPEDVSAPAEVQVTVVYPEAKLLNMEIADIVEANSSIPVAVVSQGKVSDVKLMSNGKIIGRNNVQNIVQSDGTRRMTCEIVLATPGSGRTIEAVGYGYDGMEIAGRLSAELDVI